jgi:hypothetical protein
MSLIEVILKPLPFLFAMKDLYQDQKANRKLLELTQGRLNSGHKFLAGLIGETVRLQFTLRKATL